MAPSQQIRVAPQAGQTTVTLSEILEAAQAQGALDAGRLDDHDRRRCCGEHFSDPHAAGCTADVDNLQD